MPLAMSLSARGWQVTGSKTTQDGVEAARMSGIDSYLLRMEPELVCDSDDLDALMDADALVITLPARRSGPGDEFYLQAVQELVDSALAHRIPRIIFTSSTSVYGDAQGTVKETTPRNPVTNSGRVLEELEDGAAFNQLPAFIAINPGSDTELTNQNHGLFLRVVQEDRRTIAAIVHFTFMADNFAVFAREIVSNVVQGEIVIGENFVFNEGDLLRHTDSTARNEQLSYAVKSGLSAQAISEI